MQHKKPAFARSACAAVFAAVSVPVRANLGDQIAKLVPEDGAPYDLSGFSVAIGGDAVVVGSPGDNASSGSAYVFAIVEGEWAQTARLVPDDGAHGDDFGSSIALSGTSALIGAYGDGDNGDSSGSAYVFEEVGGSWMQLAKLLPSDGAPVDFFGDSVAMSGNIAIIGAPGDDDNGDFSGSAYVFERIGGVWIQVTKLLALDGAPWDSFGVSVAVSGTTVVVGASGDDGFAGSVYVFMRVDGAWTQVARLTPDDGAPLDFFGDSVAMRDHLAIVGAPFDDDNGDFSGSAYLFENVDAGWREVAKITAADGAPSDVFGYSVAIDGATAVVGALSDDDNGQDAGSAYLFEDVAGVWTQVAKLLPDDGDAGDFFGRSVAIDGSTAVVGADRDEERGERSGSAYLFDAKADCPADFNGDGTLNLFDFLAFQTAFGNGDPAADLNHDLVLNLYDFLAFQTLFGNGC